MRRVCADTGFLIALYGKKKNKADYEGASSRFKQLFAGPGHELVVPWPVLYEAVNIQLVENPRRIQKWSKTGFDYARITGSIS